MFTDTSVKCVGTYADGKEAWSAQVWRGDELVAMLSGFSSRAEAEKAADYVFAGAKRDWNLLAPPSKQVIAAGVRAFQEAESDTRLRIMSRSTLRRHLVSVIHGAMLSAHAVEDRREAT